MHKLAMVLKIRNEEPYLLEWLAFHLNQGASFFKIYDESTTIPNVALQELAKHYPIEYSYQEVKLTNSQDRVWLQLQKYIKASKELVGVSEFVAFTDADEFVYNSEGKLTDILNGYDSTVSAIAMNQKVYASSGKKYYEPDLVVRRFTKRGVNNSGDHFWTKIIARPERIKTFHSPHSCAVTEGNIIAQDGSIVQTCTTYRQGRLDKVINNNFRLNHYMTKSLEEFKIKQINRKRDDEDITSKEFKYKDGYFNSRDVEYNIIEDDSALINVNNVINTMKEMHNCLKDNLEVYNKLKQYYYFL